MRKSLEIIGPYFKEFSSADARFPTVYAQKFEKLTDEITALLKEKDMLDSEVDFKRSIQDLISICYNNGVKDGKKLSNKNKTPQSTLKGKIIHSSLDFKE
jgi:hypothetical protein